MGVLYTKIPDNIKKEIVDPYISIKDSEARISLRIKDSLENLRRNDLLNKINYVIEKTIAKKINNIKAKYIKTRKNEQVNNFFEKCSFVIIESTDAIKKYNLVVSNYKSNKLNYIEVVYGK